MSADRTSKTHLIWVLERALEKLTIYRENSSGEYQGGMEHRALRMELEATLEELRGVPPQPGESNARFIAGPAKETR
jgi:hypothetical protein